jgi:hypothetical protein
MKTWLSTKLFRRPSFSFLSLSGSLVLVAASCLLIWVKAPDFPLAVPLWFSKTWGKDWLTAPVLLWLIPLISFLIILINFGLARLFSERERLISLILLGSGLITCFLLFYSLLNIILVAT